MSKTTILSLLLIFSFPTVFYGQSSSWNNETKQKYKREIYSKTGIKDSITVISIQYDEYDSGYLYLVESTNSSYHANFDIYFDPGELYYGLYQTAIERYDGVFEQKKLPDFMKGDWVPVTRYANDYVLFYTYCNYMSEGISINDSTIVEYYMDGPAPEVVKQYRGTESSFTLTTLGNHVYEFKLLPSGVYQMFEDGVERMVLTKEESVSKFNVLVELCHEMGFEMEIPKGTDGQ